MKANRARWPIAMMARLLGVSTSGYYTWLVREPAMHTRSDAQLLSRIRTLHASSRGTYGAPRIHAQLAREGVQVGRKRVARLMRMAGLCGASRRRWPRTTRPRAGARRAPDLVRRHFSADATNVLWVADATYVPTGEGFLYLAVVLDVFSRRIIGWAMSNHLYTELMLRALDMSLQQRRHDGVILHSDQGCQYTSIAFGRRCREAGVQPSMGTAGDAYDTRCASRSSAHSKPNCSVANTSRPTNRHGGVCSRFWNWVAPCPCGHGAPEEPYVRVSPHTARAPR
ncbi:transposase InsO family protein [Paraburkholderia sp. UCT70]|uniref:IS3 family transposase n=1 Tax=Paraburkholderia sp. UCT70 TaxID=2991068 RepID=UPI003D1B8F57